LPAGWSEPRVSLEPRHVWVGTRWHAGPLSALVWVRADVRLRSPGEIAVAVDAPAWGGCRCPVMPCSSSWPSGSPPVA
ncbi:MAG: hypothetical protein ACOYK7_07395, partial [Pirellulales bacterium]